MHKFKPKWYILLLMALLLTILAMWYYFNYPSRCVLCDSPSYHAPCLVNLATGEVGELTVYDPHPYQKDAFWIHPESGTFSFLECAGLQGYRDTARNQCRISIPATRQRISRNHFCRSCRKQLAPYSGQGYALADLYPPHDPTVFQITGSIRYSMRCYEITAVFEEARQVMEVTVRGLYE